MGVVSVRQCAQWAHDAGFVSTDLITITAICGAESGYNTNAHALTSREDSRGLAQINVWAHPWGAKINLYDGATNLSAAFRVFREAGASFRPWSTFTSGSYKNYWTGAVQAVNGVNPGPPPPDTVVYIRPPYDVPDDYSGHVQRMADRFKSGAGQANGLAKLVYNLHH